MQFHRSTGSQKSLAPRAVQLTVIGLDAISSYMVIDSNNPRAIDVAIILSRYPIVAVR